MLEKIKKIKRDNEKNWLSISGVVSVGIGYVKEMKTGIIIGVKNKNNSVIEKIPAKIDGIDIEIKTVGKLNAF